MAKHIKSERLKKMETELNDLEQWLKLGLVPKKDIEKHKEEIETVKAKMHEEKERLRFLKESGDLEEYTPPKRAQTRAAFTEMPTIPDIDLPENTAQEGSYNNEDTTIGASSVIEENDEAADEPTVTTDTDEESYFSDKNRWRRGGIVDPDADEW